jgi:hypothetical protein
MILRGFLLLLLLLAIAGPPLSAAELVRLPGTCVELAPPLGMTPSTEFAGFSDPEKGSAMLVVELPIERKDFPQFLAALSDEVLVAQGLSAIERGLLPDGVPGNLLIRARHSAHGIPFERWIYVAPSERALAMITVQVPQQFASDAAAADLRASLATVRIISELATGLPLPDAIEALPFAYEAGKRFAVRSVIAGNTVLLKASDAPDRTEAILLISKSLAMGGEDHLEVSTRALESLEGVQRIEIDEMYDEVAIGDLMGIELTARCTEKGSGEPCVAYQMMLFATDAAYRVLGVTHADLSGAYLPEFRRVARSLVPR